MFAFLISSSFFPSPTHLPTLDGTPGTDKQLVLMNDQRGTLETLDAALEQNKVRKRSLLRNHLVILSL